MEIKKRILIVDDDETLDEAVKEALEETERYEVKWETRGAHAQEAAKTFHPDLILLDIHLPDVMGGEIARLLMENRETRSIPIAYFTALVSREEIASRGGMIGGIPCIAKPVNVQELMRFIESCVR